MKKPSIQQTVNVYGNGIRPLKGHIKNCLVLLVGLFVTLPIVALAQELAMKDGLYKANTAMNEPFTVKIAKDKDGLMKIAYLGYHFQASLSVDRTFLKSRKPFGKSVGNKIIFQFPVMLSFSPSNNINNDSGGKINIAYFKGEIIPKEKGELSCVMTQIKALDNEYEGKFTMEDIDLAPPAKDKKLEKSYSLILKLVEKKK
jgi:hypothetical protein